MKPIETEPTKRSSSLLGVGIITAFAASLCCITPVLAFFSGVSGIAASFSFMEPIRPYLIGFTALMLGFAWYQKLKPRKAEEIQCACEDDPKPKFIQSRMFLGIITIFAGVMLAFPKYAHIFYPEPPQKEVVYVNTSNIETITFKVKGMTCAGCASHVEHDVNKLAGVISVSASYPDETAKVEFDKTRLSLEKIEETINATGYSVVGKETKTNTADE